jgi:hypothetical protein
MNIMNILLQIPANTSAGSVSTVKIIIFWIVVAICVAVFFYFLKRTDRLIDERAKLNKPEPNLVPVNTRTSNHEEVPDEEAAAIALAIHLYKSQLHDMESFTITLQKVTRIYSPWSSKIYTLRQNPR